MKLNGIMGKGSGKLGSSVFAISGGEQIVRQYNPVVSNPQTDAQVAQRAKLKLMSQLAAVFAPALAYKKNGLVSARNQFISRNIPQAEFEHDTASIDMLGLKLTPKDANQPSLTITNTQGGGHGLQINLNLSAGIAKVVVVEVNKNDDDTFSIANIKYVDSADQERVTTDLDYAVSGGYVYVFGLKFSSTEGKTRFDNYVAAESGTDAILDLIRALSISAGDAQGTKAAALD